jgi:cell division protein FtsZ
MVEYDRHALKESVEPGSLKTCIVGVGGAGGNVLDRITLDRTVDAKLVSVHTDIRVLGHSMTPHKVQLGVELMRGVGAGGDPDLGREAAVFSREQIREAVDGHDIVFICTGLGGGTGSGAAPVIADIAKSTGALVFLTATMPFSFEGKRRLKQAEESLEQLQKRADALILFENNRMGELTLPKDGIQKAFTQADQLIAQSLRAVSTILTTPGLVKLGLDDLTAALNTSNGRCLFGFGEARGQNRGNEAVKRALKSPLIDQGRLLHQTKTLLVHIAGGESLTLLEVDAIMKQLGKNVPDQTHILFGVAVDPKLGDSVCVTLLSSLGLAQLNTVAAAAPPVEMLPIKERSMPSIMDSMPSVPKAAKAPKPAPAEDAMEMLFRTEEISAPAAPTHLTVEPEPQPEVEEEIVSQEVPVEEPAFEAPETPEAFEAPVAQEEPPPFEDEIVIEQEVTAYIPEPEPEPVKPARPPRPRIEDFIPQTVARPATTTLAAVVARNPAPPVEDASFMPASRTPKVSEEEAQIAFQFGSEQDRGRRFQQTEPVLADGGEDLDVPTWMRLKRKLKR